MAEHRWSILCRRAIVDKFTNHLSLIDVVDDLTIEEDTPPSEAPPDNIGVTVDGQFVSLWVRHDLTKPEKFWQHIFVTGPRGESQGTAVTMEGRLSENPRVRLLVGIKAIRFYGPGKYTFNVYHSKTEKGKRALVAQVPFYIKEKAEPSSSSEP